MNFQLSDAQHALRARARALADDVFRGRAARWDANEEYPWDNVAESATAGFMGITVPAEYGGPGGSALDALVVVEEIARACGVTARIVVEGSLGVVGALSAYGTDPQKRRYLPWVLEGEKPAIAITEPGGRFGRDGLDDPSRRNGRRLHAQWLEAVDHGRRHVALYLVFCRMGPASGAEGIGAILVERDTPGFHIGERDRTMGLRGIPEGRLHFEDCRVPRANVLVCPPDGFKKLMRAYNSQRLGAATSRSGWPRAYQPALAYATERHQFGRAIAEFQGIRWKLADMAIAIHAARLLIYRAAANAGAGFPDALEAAKAKTFAAEMAQAVTGGALQIHGAAGYGRALPLERMVRDARMFTIGGGTVEMMRNLIADRILPVRSDFRV